MKQTIKLAAFVVTIILTGSSCKKNWTCTRSYPGDPNDPNSAIITQSMDITAKSKRDAKLECENFADPGDTWELKAK